ncbi:MAG: hypothetical protein JSV51_07915 [Candidatus Bathyarchaeota archaeon]|nr:MAG: hypothetical protein JSV51_07915 [Candidatus Bathyarchaeota archaeon]
MSLTVRVKYMGMEKTFVGDVDSVWVNVNRFFSQMVPLIAIARRAVLTVNLEEAIRAGEGLVAVAEEGPMVLVSKQRLTDNESLLLKLLAAYIGGRLGVLDRIWLSREELKGWLGKSGKITGTRLGELCHEGLVAKTEEGRYRLSTFGIKQLIEEILPRIKRKT